MRQRTVFNKHTQIIYQKICQDLPKKIKIIWTHTKFVKKSNFDLPDNPINYTHKHLKNDKRKNNNIFDYIKYGRKLMVVVQKINF